jgi:hypothetical protein
MTTPDHSLKPLKLITLPKPTGAKPGNLSDQAFEIHLTIEDAEDQINDLIECIEKPNLNSDGAKQIAQDIEGLADEPIDPGSRDLDLELFYECLNDAADSLHNDDIGMAQRRSQAIGDLKAALDL